MSFRGRNVLTLQGATRESIVEVLDVAASFADPNGGSPRKRDDLHGRVVASIFFEESTRTRLSFETAAKRLSADVVSLAVASSSVKKGESLRDTIATIEALGVDAVIMRHKSSGAAEQVARFAPNIRVINAGDGLHQHPSQGLLDVYTVREILAARRGVASVDSGSSLFAGLKVLIIGDIRHSRVARSDIDAYAALGAEVRVAGPATLLPSHFADWPVTVVTELDAALAWADVIGLLRLQTERGTGAFVPSLSEFTFTYGLTTERLSLVRPEAIILHPGPMNRGVEVDSVIADSSQAFVTTQVANGVPVRMALLALSLSTTKEPS